LITRKGESRGRVSQGGRYLGHKLHTNNKQHTDRQCLLAGGLKNERGEGTSKKSWGTMGNEIEKKLPEATSDDEVEKNIKTGGRKKYETTRVKTHKLGKAPL